MLVHSVLRSSIAHKRQSRMYRLRMSLRSGAKDSPKPHAKGEFLSLSDARRDPDSRISEQNNPTPRIGVLGIPCRSDLANFILAHIDLGNRGFV